MMSKKIVIALGGNALGNTPDEQYKAVKITAKSIVDLIEQGHKVIVGHGNGPQVGMISLAFDEGSKVNNKVPSIPLHLAGAMSQGYIGLHLQQAIKNELIKRKINRNVVSLITQSMVDENDPSMKNPTKPIGSFYTEKEAEKIREETGWVINKVIDKANDDRTWRRVVPSPKPIDIVEKDVIKHLFENGTIVVAGGGGGIPTINPFVGMNSITALASIDAVIDKDFTSEKIAELVEADLFMIVTVEDGVFEDFGEPTAKKIPETSYLYLEQLVGENKFPEGSMKPKVEAVCEFVKNTKKEAIITSLEKTADALKGKAGTKIIS